jgi:hypothetical protein
VTKALDSAQNTHILEWSTPPIANVDTEVACSHRRLRFPVKRVVNFAENMLSL